MIPCPAAGHSGLVFCVYKQTDPNNCGGCGITCPAAAPSCQNGNCVVDASTNAMGAPETGAPETGTDAGTAASCAPGGPGMTNCGLGGSGTESCCTSLEMTGGTYYRTYNTLLATSGPPVGGWPDLADPATISSFRLDKYLVTVGRFRQFVNAWNGGNGEG